MPKQITCNGSWQVKSRRKIHLSWLSNVQTDDRIDDFLHRTRCDTGGKSLNLLNFTIIKPRTKMLFIGKHTFHLALRDRFPRD